MKEFLVIIPVYNEKSTVYDVALRTIAACLDFADILFVDDGSSDGTDVVLDSIQKEHPYVFVHHKKNAGYGSSLIYGFEFGAKKNYPYLITMDCDEQHQPKDLERFANYNRKIEVVSGSRYAPKSKSIGIVPPEDRVEINRRITTAINNKYGWYITDAFCGFKRYTTSSLKNYKFTENGYAFPMEFWAYARKNNLSLAEIAVDKIYITDDRTFGEDLDKKRKRYKYYLEAWRSAERNLNF